MFCLVVLRLANSTASSVNSSESRMSLFTSQTDTAFRRFCVIVLLSQFLSQHNALEEHSAAHDDTGHISSKHISVSNAAKSCRTSGTIFWISLCASFRLLNVRERPIQVKRPMSDIPIFRRKNSDVRFRFRYRSC